MSFDYGFTCPEIDKNIRSFKDDLGYHLQSIFNDHTEGKTDTEIDHLAQDYARHIYSDAENIFENVRETNEGMRQEAERQIEDLNGEIENLKNEIENLENKIENLENENENLEIRIQESAAE